MRRGVTEISLGWCGFEPFYSYIGKPDIYGNLLHSTQINLLDSLATSATLVMGEGNEQTPLALIQNAPKINFQNRSASFDEEQSIIVTMDKCLYSPLLMGAHWHKLIINPPKNYYQYFFIFDLKFIFNALI